MSAEEAAFQAGVEAMRAQVLAYLTDPKMRQTFVMMGPRVLAVVAHEVEAMHPGYVKARVVKKEVNMNKEGINMTMDQLRKVVQWANAQPEAYWLPDPPATPPNVATVIAMYEAVMFMGSSIEEMVAPLPLPWESYNVEERKAINVVRAGLGMEARR